MTNTNDLLQSMSDFEDGDAVETSRDQKGPLAGKTDLDHALLECFGLLLFPNRAIKKRWERATVRSLGGREPSIAFEKFTLHVLKGLDVSDMSIGQVITMISSVSDKKLVEWHIANKETPDVSNR